MLSALVHSEASRPPWSEPPPWSKTVLARVAGLHEKHTVFRHLEVLVLAGLLIEEAASYHVNEDSALLSPIRALIDELERLEHSPLPPSRGGHR